jgi:hypothetical protein
VRLVEFREKENKWTFTGSVFNEDHLNIRKLKSTTKFEDICELARMARLNYAISKINQAITLIHDCVSDMYNHVILQVIMITIMIMIIRKI